jgi:tetratricopeptide (TPR) repeat protein
MEQCQNSNSVALWQRNGDERQLDQTSSAVADFSAARDIYSHQSDPTSRLNRAVNEVSLGALAEKDNRYSDALALYSTALPEIEKAGRAPNADRSILQAYAGTLTDLGSVQGKMGKYELSEQNFRKAIEMYGSTTPQAGRVWSNLGDMLLARDRETDADTALRTALAIPSRDPADIGVAHTYTSIAELEARQGNLDASWQHAVRAFEIWNQAHDRDGEQSQILELSRAIHNLGVLALDRGDSNSAIQYLRRAIALRPIDRSPEELMATWIASADLAVAVRKPTDAPSCGPRKFYPIVTHSSFRASIRGGGRRARPGAGSHSLPVTGGVPGSPVVAAAMAPECPAPDSCGLCRGCNA